MAFPQGIYHTFIILYETVCVCVCVWDTSHWYKWSARKQNNVCLCVCVWRLLFSWLKHISVGNNCTSLAQPSQPITKWRKPEPLGPPPIADTRVWLVRNMCVRQWVCCVWMCVFWGDSGKKGHGLFHLKCPQGWRRRRRGCGFRGDESEVSISRGGEQPKPPLLSSRFVPPPVSHCWAF